VAAGDARVAASYFGLSLEQWLAHTPRAAFEALGVGTTLLVDCSYIIVDSSSSSSLRNMRHCENKQAQIAKTLLFTYVDGTPAFHVTVVPRSADDAKLLREVIEQEPALRQFFADVSSFLRARGIDAKPVLIADRGFSFVKDAMESLVAFDDPDATYISLTPTFLLDDEFMHKFCSAAEIDFNRAMAVHRAPVEQTNSRVQLFRVM